MKRSRQFLPVWILLAVALLAVPVGLAATAVFGSLFCKTFPVAGTYWVSLPVVSPIETAEQLCEAITGATDVTEGLSGPTYACAATTCTPTVGAITCAGGAVSNCFCIDPGEGFQVTVNALAPPFQILGQEAPVVIKLLKAGVGSVNGETLISLPYDSTAASARDLFQEVGVAQAISRYLPATGTTQAYTFGSADFPLTPGEAYVVKVSTDINFSPQHYASTPVFPTCNTQCSRYVIQGTPNSPDWPWSLDDASLTFVCGAPAAPITSVGSGSALTLTDDFVTSIGLQCGTDASAGKPVTGAPLFEICLGPSWTGPPRLWVASPTCEVGPAGCTYNPTIRRYTVPPGVPDGTNGRGLSVGKLNAAGSSLRVWWDANGCREAVNYELLYGMGSQLPDSPGGPYALSGAQCGIGTSSPFTWPGVPNPSTDSTRLLWFLAAATNGMTTEGPWGPDSLGNERTGPGSGGASNQCGITTKNQSNACGQ